MKILALEFSSSQRGVAVLRVPERGGDTAVVEVVETGGRSMSPLGMVEGALREAGLEREEIGCLAVGLGPGSYVGIRASIALSQGWQLASPVKLLGIGSAECIATVAWENGMRGEVDVVIDAQRQEFYQGRYVLDSAGVREASPLQIVTLGEVRQRQSAGARLVGPDIGKLLPEAGLVFPRAATLARLARGREDFPTGEKLEPIYLRETNFVKAPPSRVIPLAG
jgi:tRNA threonylcarbamoyl adenosine modification protein YeaZ